MKTRNIGICLDHSIAHLIEVSDNMLKIHSIKSEFTHQEKEHSISKNENLMHNKEQHEQLNYYNKIGDVVRNYTHVILFGPTTAKSELLNLLKSNHQFDNIKIDVSNTDKMTENQQKDFVKDHFKSK
jgi:stalled ribosome rescue protein Dom34